MADYWVSQQRHWCKYCKKYVANNKPSIALHENGRSHKDQVERFLRGVYTKGRKDIEEAENVREELERIERAACQAMGQAYVPSSKPATKRNVEYYVDPAVPTIEELRQQAYEEQQQIKPEAVEGRDEWSVNTEIAKVGEWETVVAQPSTTSQINHDTNNERTEGTATHDQAPQFQDDDEDEEDLHTFKLKEKELDVPIEDKIQEDVTFKKRKLGDSAFKSRKKKPLRKKD